MCFFKFIDFGIMRLYDSKLTEDETHLGTRGYASPEHFGGKGQTDARSDIYSIGVTMHRLLTGFDPAMSTSLPDIREIDPSLPRYLSDVIKKCTEPDRSKRFQSCDELKNFLDEKLLYSKQFHKNISDFFKRK